MGEIRKTECTYSQLIAGALLSRFDSINNVDIGLLINNIEDKLGVRVVGSLDNLTKELIRLIEFGEDDGTISLGKKLRKLLKLDGDIYDKLRDIVKEILEKEAGPDIIEYFRSLHMGSYRDKKRKLFSSYKEQLPKQARVLLISESQEDYDEFVSRGFRNVNWFKSIIRANKYFAQNPDKLENHDIIVFGDRSVIGLQFDLVDRIWEMAKRKHTAVVSIERKYYEYLSEIPIWIYNNTVRSGKYLKATDSDGVYSAIVECALTNCILSRDNENSVKFEAIPDYVNPKVVPLPTKRENVRILYLTNNGNTNTKLIGNCVKKMGLNVEVIQDGDTALLNNVQGRLGDYDIIIASSHYSQRLLGMINESKEQCKDTGRQKVLLATYSTIPKSSSYHVENGKPVSASDASEITLNYVSDGTEPKKVSFMIPCGDNSSAFDRTRINTEAIISTAIDVYRRALKTQEELNKEYELHRGCRIIDMFLQAELVKSGLNEITVSLSDGYTVAMRSNCITISGIYDGNDRSFSIHKDERGKYKTLPSINRKAFTLFVSEIAQIISSKKKRRKHKTLNEAAQKM